MSGDILPGVPDAARYADALTRVRSQLRGNAEWLWAMHPELAAALESLSWVLDAQ